MASKQRSKRNTKTELVCLCNEVSRETIESAIRCGANTLNKIFDSTTAGVGPCGGSCRKKLQPMLERFLTTGSFATTPSTDLSGDSADDVPAAKPNSDDSE